MSILKNNRRQSEIEYEYNYTHRLYREIKDRMDRVPRKYYDTVCQPILTSCNNIYMDILDVSQLYREDKKDKSDERLQLCMNIIDEIEVLIQNLYLYWNLSSWRNTSIKSIKFKSRKYLSKLINRQIGLILGVARYINSDKAESIKEVHMYPFNYKKIMETDFLKELYLFERNIIKIRKDLPTIERNAEILIAKTLAVKAFYCAYTANNTFPTTKREYTRRKNLFREAISSLYKINRPLGEVFMHESYVSNKMQAEASEHLNNALRMIQAVQKSDKERFSEL